MTTQTKITAVNKIGKCNNGECRACHDGINEENPTGQRGECPFNKLKE